MEAKTTHVEKGHEWTALLDRHFKLCVAAAKRGAGPRKKAPEVPESAWSTHPLLSEPKVTRAKVNWAAHLFALAVRWMLREIEVANLTSTGIKFDPSGRIVSMFFRESKTDSEGFGVTRTLQCMCEGGCDLRCPYTVLGVLVNNAALKGATKGDPATTPKGSVASKSDVVGAWRTLFGKPVTGHSGRRSGALQYIR